MVETNEMNVNRSRVSRIPGPAAEPAEVFDASEGKAAFERIEVQIRSIATSEIRRMHISTPRLAGFGLCYARHFGEDREAFARAFTPEFFNVTDFDDMRDRAIAYWYLTICERQNDGGALRKLVIEAKPLRAKLLKAAVYLWEGQTTIGDVVANIRAGRAHFNKADDMGALAKLFEDNWEEAEGNCGVTKEDVYEAQKLGARFLEALSMQRIDDSSDATLLRRQAGEYLCRGIDTLQATAGALFRGDETRLARYPKVSVMRDHTRTDAEDDIEVEVDETDDADQASDPAVSTSEPAVQSPESPIAEANAPTEMG